MMTPTTLDTIYDEHMESLNSSDSYESDDYYGLFSSISSSSNSNSVSREEDQSTRILGTMLFVTGIIVIVTARSWIMDFYRNFRSRQVLCDNSEESELGKQNLVFQQEQLLSEDDIPDLDFKDINISEINKKENIKTGL